MTDETAALDIRAEIARIDRNRAEARKLDIESRKIDEERRLYVERQLSEMRKFDAEREKLFAEALKLERERRWFSWVQLLAVAGSSAAIAAIISRLIQ